MSSPELIVKIGANSEKYRRELKKIEGQSDASIARMQKRAQAAAAVVAVSVAGGLAAFNEFRKFEKDFSNVVTLLDDTSFKTKTLSKGIVDLKDGVKALAIQSGASFDVLNQGLFDLISAGVSAEKAISALGVATNLALAGNTDTSVAVDGITSALNAYNLSADQAQSVAEKFFTAQKFGKTTIEELSGSFGKVGATAAGLGVDLDELLASVSAVTTAGVGTSEAFTGIKAALANVIKPTKDAQIEAKRLGIDFSTTALRSQGLAGFLDSITNAADFNADSLGKLFGSVEALNAVTALAGNQSDSFRGTLAALGNEAQSAATFQDALAVKTDTADQKMRRMQSAVSAAAVSLGEFVAPAVIVFAEQTALRVTQLGKGMKALGTIIGGVATILVESLGSAFVFILSGIASLDSKLSSFFASLNEKAANIPFIGDERRAGFQANADRLNTRSEERDFDADNLAAQATQFFTDQDVEAQFEREQGLADGKNEILAESLEAQREIRVEAEEADREAGLSDPLENQTDEEFEETAQRLEDRSGELLEGKQKALTDEEKAQRDAANKIIKINEEKAKKLKELDDKLTNTIKSNLNSLFDQQTAVGKAVFIFEQARAIADTIITTQEAGMLAYASQLIPGDPTSIARAEAARAITYAKGAVAVGLIGAQTVAGVSAQQGGIVAGVGSGDRVPAMLEAGEIVVPRKFNPLSPNFEETFGGLGGGGSVKVDLTLDENASKILTAQQREDKRLGVSR